MCLHFPPTIFYIIFRGKFRNKNLIKNNLSEVHHFLALLFFLFNLFLNNTRSSLFFFPLRISVTILSFRNLDIKRIVNISFVLLLDRSLIRELVYSLHYTHIYRTQSHHRLMFSVPVCICHPNNLPRMRWATITGHWGRRSDVNVGPPSTR